MARLPALFVSHGSPMIAIEDDPWSRALTVFAARIPKPRAAVVVSGVVVLVLAVVVLPSVPTPRGSGAVGQARHAFAPRVIAVLAVSFLTFAAMLSAITYLVPFLGEVTGVSGAAVSIYLFVYGLATAVGSFGGGRFADADAAVYRRAVERYHRLGVWSSDATLPYASFDRLADLMQRGGLIQRVAPYEACCDDTLTRAALAS